MNEAKPYKEQDATAQTVNEPVAAYNLDVVPQGIFVDIPQADMAFFKELAKKMGWHILSSKPLLKDNTSKRDIVERLYGAISLPEDFDYKQELQSAVVAKYLKR